MIHPDSDYRELIRKELARRRQVNAAYSMTAFARDLGLAPSRLSEVLSGKQGLSRGVATRIANVVGLNSEQMELFCDLVEVEHARSQEGRTLAKIRLQKRALESGFFEVQEDAFKAISDWYHMAILELIQHKICAAEPKAIAHHLGISLMQADDAIQRLIKLKILEQDLNGQLLVLRDHITTTDNVPSEAIKNFHRQILSKALLSVDFQSVMNRNLSANIFAMKKADMPRAKEMLKRFRRRFAKDLSSVENPDSVYCLGMQLFELKRDHE